MSERGKQAYRAALAQIHDAGFTFFARAAAPVLIAQLRAAGFSQGLVTELGSGSGTLAAEVCGAGYSLVGYDISPAMLALARRRVPVARFEQGSFLDVKFEPSIGVVAVGEIFNYLFDARNSPARLQSVFRRVYRALAPGGVLLFDVALVGREPTGQRRGYTENADWACLFEAREDGPRKLLERRIVTFIREGQTFRRDQEVHRLRLYERRELMDPLRELGFRVRALQGYGDFAFPPGYTGILATKPWERAGR